MPKPGEFFTAALHPRDKYGKFTDKNKQERTPEEQAKHEHRVKIARNLAIVATIGEAMSIYTFAGSRGAIIAATEDIKSFDDLHRLFQAGKWVGEETPFGKFGRPLSTLKVEQDPKEEFHYLNPIAYKHLERDTHAKTIGALIGATKDKPIEFGFLVDEKGRILAGFRGIRGAAPCITPSTLTREDRSNISFFHNHPQRDYKTDPLSEGDITVLGLWGFKRMYAADANGSLYTLENKGGGRFTEYTTFRMAQKAPKKRFYREFVTGGPRSSEEDSLEILESHVRRSASLNPGLSYERKHYRVNKALEDKRSFRSEAGSMVEKKAAEILWGSDPAFVGIAKMLYGENADFETIAKDLGYVSKDSPGPSDVHGITADSEPMRRLSNAQKRKAMRQGAVVEKFSTNPDTKKKALAGGLLAGSTAEGLATYRSVKPAVQALKSTDTSLGGKALKVGELGLQAANFGVGLASAHELARKPKATTSASLAKNFVANLDSHQRDLIRQTIEKDWTKWNEERKRRGRYIKGGRTKNDKRALYGGAAAYVGGGSAAAASMPVFGRGQEMINDAREKESRVSDHESRYDSGSKKRLRSSGGDHEMWSHEGGPHYTAKDMKDAGKAIKTGTRLVRAGRVGMVAGIPVAMAGAGGVYYAAGRDMHRAHKYDQQKRIADLKAERDRTVQAKRFVQELSPEQRDILRDRIEKISVFDRPRQPRSRADQIAGADAFEARMNTPERQAKTKAFDARMRMSGADHAAELRRLKGISEVGKSEVTWEGQFSKADEDKRQVFGWASVTHVDGAPVVDLQGDMMMPDELEKAAYDYVLKSRIGGDMHARVDEDGKLISKSDKPHHVADLIESMVFTPEKIEKMGLPSDFPTGWWVGFKVHDDDVWGMVKKGERKGFSIHGLGKRVPVEKAYVPFRAGPNAKKVEQIHGLPKSSKHMKLRQHSDPKLGTWHSDAGAPLAPEETKMMTGSELATHFANPKTWDVNYQYKANKIAKFDRGHRNPLGPVENSAARATAVGALTGIAGGAAYGLLSAKEGGKPAEGVSALEHYAPHVKRGAIKGGVVGATVNGPIGGTAGGLYDKVMGPPRQPKKPRQPKASHPQLFGNIGKAVGANNRMAATGMSQNDMQNNAMQQATDMLAPQVAQQIMQLQQQHMEQLRQDQMQMQMMAQSQGNPGQQQGPGNAWASQGNYQQPSMFGNGPQIAKPGPQNQGVKGPQSGPKTPQFQGAGGFTGMNGTQ